MLILLRDDNPTIKLVDLKSLSDATEKKKTERLSMFFYLNIGR